MSKQPEKITITAPKDLSLGKTVAYESEYNPSLLQGVPRSLSRDTLGLSTRTLPFDGSDIWTGYELSWLNKKGKPQVAILECQVPVTSPNLIESKSFKLYLNSFNQSAFRDAAAVSKVIEQDLSRCADAPVHVQVIEPSAFSSLKMVELSGTVIDDEDIEVNQYQPDASLLKTTDSHADETLVSHLLKSNCLITSQPDWASIQIRYKGPQIERSALLKYLVSFRQHNEFHEQCVERIFCDLLRHCRPDKLTVNARYTRRGGLDINPFRSNFEAPYANHRLARQ
ncbi:NADPH-dependent 7-cyano-7-deazaguanine reductase QueF [Alteromonas halophila]|uniref:NADPH-dependent 7-cyano-7-deazaguanine reductase n=1 Tax=Alteromonas halophila TaxID=516698 RepID=A0A918JBL4_9ALTE|nr:NADPH-dependent 7-cyano-7-deazaguanine reductase QueF [Alteromonas halophila]GGW73026.1 NADPH-dependent 7-cyano-7-deazaguanine reductase [Alteromonas halophila]